MHTSSFPSFINLAELHFPHFSLVAPKRRRRKKKKGSSFRGDQCTFVRLSAKPRMGQ